MIVGTIRRTLTVAQVTGSWPTTAAAFARHGMACVGCAMARFDTLAEVAATYRLDLPEWLEELSRLVGVSLRPPATPSMSIGRGCLHRPHGGDS